MRERKKRKRKSQKNEKQSAQRASSLYHIVGVASFRFHVIHGGGLCRRAKKKNFDVEERIDGFIYLLTFQRELWRPTHGNDQMDLSLLGYSEIEMTR